MVDLGLAILPWMFWWLVRKKDSTARLLVGGLTVLVLSSYLDMLGMALGLWGYNALLIPTIPAYVPWDFTLMPVVAMLFYQYKPKIEPIYKAIIYAAIGSFLVQPFFAWLNLYNPQNWKHYYSFPIMFTIYIAGHLCTKANSFGTL